MDITCHVLPVSQTMKPKSRSRKARTDPEKFANNAIKILMKTMPSDYDSQ